MSFILKLYRIFYNHYLHFYLSKKKGCHITSISSIGKPIIEIRGSGQLTIQHCFMCNTAKSSTLGSSRRCKLLVYDKANLYIEGPVGMSNTVIVATIDVYIGKKVMIGADVTIIDSDFHSINPNHRFTPRDECEMKREPVYIGNNVFIGTQSVILKGVNIGDNSIIAACSVVCQNVPPNEIWGGNPARFIKKINF